MHTRGKVVQSSHVLLCQSVRVEDVSGPKVCSDVSGNQFGTEFEPLEW
jgi:hypothetical protein